MGNVYSTKLLELASKSRVHGNVYYTQVEMAAGSEVNGSLARMIDADAIAETSGTDAELAEARENLALNMDLATKVD